MITYNISDADGNQTAAPASITVTYLDTPPAVVADEDLNNALGSTVGINVLSNDILSDGTTPTPADVVLTLVIPSGVTIVPSSEVLGADGNLIGFEVDGEGVWLYNETSGVLEFTPASGFEGDPTVINYTIEDEDNNAVSVNTTVTITYQDRPVAVNDEDLDNTPGDTVTFDIVGNDTDGDGNLDPTTVDLIQPVIPGVTITDVVTSTDGDVIGFTVPGEGVWSYDETTGETRFDPIDGFTGDPTVITYNISDADGNQTAAPASITVTYLDTPPVAVDNSSNDNPIGSAVTQDLLENDTLSDGTTPLPTDVTLALIPLGNAINIVTGAAGNVIGFEVPNEGVWLYDEITGEVIFTPEFGFIGNPTSIDYTITDNDNGETATANVSVDYQDIPIADDELSVGNVPGDIVSQDILVGDTDADGTIDPTSVDLVVPVNATDVITDLDGDVIGFTIPGEGVWSYNDNTGGLSFDPEEGYTGDPTPVQYTVDDNDGNTTNIATVTVEYNDVPPVVNNDSSSGNDTGNSVTIDVLGNDTLADGSTPSPEDVLFDFVVPSGVINPIVGPNGNTIGFTVPGEGDWIYDETVGEVTFTPDSDFTDDPTPIDYNLTDVDTGSIATSPGRITIDYAIEFPVTSNDESLNNPTGTTATIDILSNDMDPDGSLNPESVNLTPPTNATNIITDADGDIIGFEVPGEGVWIYDPNTGVLEFTPENGFVLDPTPIVYTVDDNDGNPSNPSTVTVDYVDVADLSLTKIVVDNDATPLVGSEITFEISVFNDGPQNATGVDVTDILPSGYDFILYSSSAGTYNENTGVWNIGDIPSGGSENLLIDVLVNAPTNTAGEYFNVAEITSSDVFDIDSVPNNDDGDQSEDDEDNAIVTPVVPMADLELTKEVVDGDLTPLIGTEISFNITITNNGPQNTTGVEVTDLLPSGYDFVLFSASTGNYNEVSGIWKIGNLDSGANETLIIDAIVLATGDYLNVAEVTASDVLDSDSIINNNDPSEDDQDDAIVTPVEAIADLSLEKEVVDGDSTPLVGSEITFRITVRNDGPQTATGVEVTDLLPSGYDFETFSSSTGSYNEVSGIWTVGNLESGAVETLLIDVTVEPMGDYLNTSEVSASNVTDSDSTPGNRDITEDDYAEAITTPIQSVADLSIRKTTVGGETRAQPGDELRFQITVSNAGPDMATNVQAEDLLPIGFEFIRFSTTSGNYDPVSGLWDIDDVPANGSQTIFIDVVVKEPTNTPNEFVNNALIIASDQIDPNSDVSSDASVDDLADGIPDDDEVSFPIQVAIADLSISKSVSNEMPNVGETLIFTLSITNDGPNIASGVAVQDILPIGFSQISAVSDSGTVSTNVIDWANLTVPLTGLELTYSAVVNMPTLEDGEYVNVAQITASNEFDPNSNPNNDDGDQSEDDEASFTILTPGTDIEILKSVDIVEPAIGQEITFTITARNLGNLDATNLEITDNLRSGYRFVSSTATKGTFDSGTGIWELPIVTTDTSEMLQIVVEVLDVDDYGNTASLIFLDQLDVNPNNDTASIDDVASICGTIYNEFSPNGDGMNDVFYIDCIDRFPNNKLTIYNRWGNIVYEKEGYDNTFEGISNGRVTLYPSDKLPVGTYYYVLDLGEGSNPKAGWLYINR
ncbi:T9SS type B sorting domain-containing protein [Aquimarina agarilytica]|uniref:T9SS type B sorting domain-containing protein n=1 Tax=Aquimarina agarilytica TaxID=1087449 RepID=UPI0002F08C00|nr:gliding motility-associated C-terminal domain-containing protein [Aquimarina agarilytica]